MQRKTPRRVTYAGDDASLEGNPTSAGMLSHFADWNQIVKDFVIMLIPFKV